MLGYRLINGEITPVKEEAETVKHIFDMYLSGLGFQKIANILNEEGVRSINGNEWRDGTVKDILTNEKYCGDLILQKYYRENHLTKRKKVNDGELRRYYIEDNHPALVSKESFAAVQERIKCKSAEYIISVNSISVFKGKIRCSCCGKNYRRKINSGKIVWCCSTYDTKGKKYCPDSKMIPEDTLRQAVAEIIKTDDFSEADFKKHIRCIEAHPNNLLRFQLIDGSAVDYIWKDRSRSESWTDEMKAAARQKALERSSANG